MYTLVPRVSKNLTLLQVTGPELSFTDFFPDREAQGSAGLRDVTVPEGQERFEQCKGILGYHVAVPNIEPAVREFSL